MNKNRLLIFIAVISVLAMLIPVATVTVSADSGTLGMFLLNPVGGNPAGPSTAGLAADSGFNITGSAVRVVPLTLNTGVQVSSWTILNYPNSNPSAQIIVSANGTIGQAFADVVGTVGHATIIANLSDGSTISIDKKWAQIANTVITPPQSIPVTWIEATKTWTATANVTDTVNGIFVNKDLLQEPHVVQGAILHWYLINGSLVSNISLTPGFFHTADNKGVNDIISMLTRATYATFVATGTTTQTTVTGANGTSTVSINATGEQPVIVVVVPEYPNTSNVQVTPEVTNINFWTSEMEKVPQVRWAGEKIVLEKYFGPRFIGGLARFSLENQSPGALEGIGPFPAATLNLTNTAQTVWTIVGLDGYARCMVISEDQGEVDVDLALYNQIGLLIVATDFTLDGPIGRPIDPNLSIGSVLNQHGFVVFYLKLESITLTNVVGKRASHDSGLFQPPNPWDPTGAGQGTTPDDTSAILNVSQDALLRARVKGWFMGDNASTRVAVPADANLYDPGKFMFNLPAGRWVLPDDWPMLAGPDWKSMRLHWDIMDNPFDTVGSPAGSPDTLGKGPYYNPYNPQGTLVAAAPVIGPFRPGLELPTPPIYSATTIGSVPAGTLLGAYDPNIMAGAIPQEKTVVPNGVLEWWDAPMPPAKITFAIQDVAVTAPITSVTDQNQSQSIAIGDAGFFKEAFKTDIYYVIVGTTKYYTNPFYWEDIPANIAIPAFVNNGGYDWNTWDPNYGAYQFWKIINRPDNPAISPFIRTIPANTVLRNNAMFPSAAQVYSDNHGEAMIWLNGNFNLNPALFTFNGLEPGFGSTVGSTTVTASADYPYFRKHTPLVSAGVTKTWTWGGMVLGPTNSPDTMILAVGNYSLTGGTPPNENGTSNKLMVWVWATDRDGKQAGVLGTQVDWAISPVTVKIDNSTSANGVSNYPGNNYLMQHINVTNGFLNGTNGVLTGSGDGTQGRSFMIAPDSFEQTLFNKFWGANGSHPMIGADGKPLDPKNFAVAAIVIVDVTKQIDATVTETLTSPDFGTLLYHTNANFAVDHPLDDNITFGDANLDGKVNIADVTAIERIILGLNRSNVQADANNNGKVNMGDVVKAERIILGIK